MPDDEEATVNCIAQATQPVPPAVNDYCGNPITPTGPVASPDPVCDGIKTYTWTYTDCKNNAHNWTFTYTIEILDFDATFPNDTDQDIDCPVQAVAPVPPVVADYCGNNITPAALAPPVAPDCDGDMVFSWAYTVLPGK